jgi:hypothetical protein
MKIVLQDRIYHKQKITSFLLRTFIVPKLIEAIHFHRSCGSRALMLPGQAMDYPLKFDEEIVEYLHGRGRK